MNTQQALQLIINATDQLKLTRTEHIRLQQAVNVLEAAGLPQAWYYPLLGQRRKR